MLLQLDRVFDMRSGLSETVDRRGGRRRKRGAYEGTKQWHS